MAGLYGAWGKVDLLVACGRLTYQAVGLEVKAGDVRTITVDILCRSYYAFVTGQACRAPVVSL
jgi:hypothetical protein